tara:strand:+ start:472 stop:1221 length:750 start_codon:yes stop_codon:yes gene_type:complete
VITPIFRSTYSIGKSILTINKSSDEGPDSIINICKDAGMERVVLVEDNLTSFMKAFNACSENGLELLYGLRLTFCNDISEEECDSEHKSIIFAQNDEGCKLLNKIYSFAFTEGGGKIDYANFKEFWDEDKLMFVVPFYDSFIHQNNFLLKNCVPDFSFLTPNFWIEKNDLPFDHLLSYKVREYISKNLQSSTSSKVKTICYKDKSDVEALQTYKILCNRNFGKQSQLSNPNLSHFGSDEFSFESYLEQA